MEIKDVLLRQVFVYRKNGMMHCKESAHSIQQGCRFYMNPSIIAKKNNCAHNRPRQDGLCDSFKASLWLEAKEREV